MKLYKYNIIFFIVFLFCYSGNSQNTDSLKILLKIASNDTSRIQILSHLAENLPDGEWETYNEKVKIISEKLLAGELMPGLKRRILI